MEAPRCANLTGLEGENETEANLSLLGLQAHELEAHRQAEFFSEIIIQWALPAVCLFGIVGNLLNLTILTRRKLQKSFRTLEQAANHCLISLAVSDLMFCVLAFLTTFQPADDVYTGQGLAYHYRMYSTAFINVFIMESTMLTVAMSLERFLAICFPLRQDLYLTTRRIKYIIVLTVIFSFCFNVPVLWRFEAVPVCPEDEVIQTFNNFTNSSDSLYLGTTVSSSELLPLRILDTDLESKFYASVSHSPESSWTQDARTSPPSIVTSTDSAQEMTRHVRYKIQQVLLWDSQTKDMAYRISWAIVGNFIPLILLFYFNVCLCRKIYLSYKLRRQFKRQSKAKSSSHILTITLVAIVVMFFLLVAPSEIMLIVKQDAPTSKSMELVLNFMQSLNFSVNFILYCIISPHFRKTLKYLLLCGCYNIYQVSREWKKEFETSLM